MKSFFKNNIVIIGLTFFIPGIIAFITKDSFSIYKSLILPKYAPPTYIFPIVWSILYLLMAIACTLVKEDNKCLVVYFFQLILNALWTPIFFSLHLYFFAFMELVLLLITVFYMTYLFYNENKYTIFLLVPYILWNFFALYLNFFVYVYN